MTKTFLFASIVKALRACCLILGALAVHLAIDASQVKAASWGSDYIPNPEFADQDGNRLKFYDDVIKGKIVVVSFIYTSCRDLCPLTTARLVQMQSLLEPEVAKNVTFVSISIDPETDTPQRLKEYAEAMGAGPGWVFLTGNKKDIDAVRHKLGERSKKRSEHRQGILLGNDTTGEWEHSSVFGDLGVLAITVGTMDPKYRSKGHSVAASEQDGSGHAPVEYPGQSIFLKTCAACHTIGRGEKVGPDLAGLASRRDQSWLVKYISAPNRVRAAKDPIALELGKRFKRVRMPNLGIAESEAVDILHYIERQTPVD